MKTVSKLSTLVALVSLTLTGLTQGQSVSSPENLDDRDARIRDRYEQVLQRSPFQDRAFTQVFDSYLNLEGVDAWVDKLKPLLEEPASKETAAILLGQIYARQFKTADAIAVLEQANQGENTRPEFNRLLGTLYYRSGNNEQGIQLLTRALETLTDLDERTQVCRMLGNLFLREGNTDQAIATWQQITATTPNDLFAQIELAEIYEENRLWDEAIAVYRRIESLSERDPYRRCRALRSIGNCQLQAERFPAAIATYESALELVSPGNWLFEDLKLRLVQVYEDMGDLAALVTYVQARLELNPADLEFRDLLAETYLRMNRLEDAEAEYQALLERNPRHAPTFEKLIVLFGRMERPEAVVETFEKLIELFPADSDYLRRLGETQWRAGEVEAAQTTWERLIADAPQASDYAELAGWYEVYDFPEKATEHYRNALKDAPNKEWTFRLAELIFDQGDTDAALKTWLDSLDPENATGADYAEVASILDAHQQIAPAEPLWRQAAEKDADTLDYRLQLARNLMRQEKYNDAVKDFTFLAEQEENLYFQERGETGRLDAYSRLGVLATKQAEWEAELRASPDSIPVISRLARLYERAGQRENALALLEKRTELKPTNADFRRALIRSYKSGRYIDQAVAELQRLANEDKNRSRVYYQELLEIYLGLDLRDEALQMAEKIVELAPADAEARLDLAQVYGLYQRPEESLQQYRYALRLEPNEPDYHRQYGSALQREKRYGEALEAFRRMLDTAKEDNTRLSAVASLAQIHLFQNSLDELVTEFTRRIRNTPKKLSAYEELARIHKEAGDPYRSVNTLEDGLQNVDDKGPALKSLIRATYETQEFDKVVSYYEQLIDQRGKPSAYEYERLGSIYAQMGDLAKAKETWDAMIDPDQPDPKSMDRLASVLQRENFINEAIEYKKAALDIDEYNYRRRWEYAQMLAANEDSGAAITELQKIIELGDRQQKENPEKVREKSVQRRSRGAQLNQGLVNPYMFIYGVQSYGGRYFGGAPRGNFAELRPQIIGFIASLAQNSIGEDALVEEYTKQVEAQPNNTQALRDLTLIYQAFGRVEDALKTAKKVLELAPNDADLLQQAAVYHSSQQEYDQAIPLLEKLAEAHPKHRAQARQGLVPLYFQNGAEEKALALADEMIDENPRNLQSVYVVANLMQQQGKLKEAVQFYEKARENSDDKRMSYNLSMNLGQLYFQMGEKEKAKAIYSEALTVNPRTFSGMGVRRQRTALYVPEVGNNMSRVRYGGGAIMNLPRTLIGSVDYVKGQAIQQLTQLAEEGENPLAPLETQANQLETATSLNAKDDAWDAAKLLVANHIAKTEYDEAQAWLEKLAPSSQNRTEWYNLALYLAEKGDDCERMIDLYDQAEKQFPSETRKIVSAKASVALLCEDYEAAGRHIEHMIQQRVPPKDLVQIIRPLVTADQSELAKTLLEQHLAGISRNGGALALLAEIYGAEDQHDQAIALAREAWDRSSHGTSNQNYRYSGYYPGPTSRPTNALLRNLHSYYVKAGKSAELIEEFTERLAKQPGSVRLHEELASLHQMNSDRDKSIEIYESLIKKRPHLAQAKQNLARLHTETGNFAKATEIYQALLKSNPNIYQQISWQLRDLYQRTGKGKEMVEMETKLAQKATNPNQIQQLASQFQRSGELEKAAELYQRAIKMSPGYPWLNRQLAEVYIQLGQHEKALELYRDWITSPRIRAQGNVDSGTIQHLTGVYASTGRLDELKEINAGFLEKNANDPIAGTLTSQIAVFEKRFDDAIEELSKIAASGRDPNAISSLMEIAELTGRSAEVFEHLKDLPAMANFYDKRRLAQLHFSQGDLKEGARIYREWVEEQSRFGGSVGYYVREAVDLYGQHGLWDEAEALIKKSFRGNLRDYDRREFNRLISETYVESGRLGGFVDSVLAKDSFKGSDAELITAIADQYRQANQTEKRAAFLKQIVDKDPGNRKLMSELARLHLNEDAERAVALAKRLVEAEGANESYRRLYADALNADKQPDQAIAMLTEWAEENPAENRYRILGDYLKRQNRLTDARAAYTESIERADASRRQAAELRLAEFDADYGRTGPELAAQAANFEAKRDANAFNQYLGFLRNHGYYAEAKDFFQKHKDDGFMDRYRNQTAVLVFTDEGDYETPQDIAWNFVRYAERYNRDHFFNEVRNIFRNRGKGQLFLDGVHERLQAEENTNQAMLMLLARSYAEAGLETGADPLYQQLIEANPFNQKLAVDYATWLSQTDRTEEAVTLLQNLPPAPTLREDVQNQMLLINYYFKSDADELAEQAIQDLLAWNQSGETESQIASVYFREKDYERASHHHESALGKYQANTYNLATRRVELGKCYAMLGETEKALAEFNRARELRNSRYQLRSLARWLMTEKRYDVAIAYLESKFERGGTPTNELRDLATCYLKSEGPEAALNAYRTHYDKAAKAARKSIRSGYTDFIVAEKLAEHFDPASAHPLDKTARVPLATRIVNSDRSPAGIEAGTRVLGDAKPTPAYHLAVGSAYIKHEQTDQAVPHFVEALKAKAVNPLSSAARNLIDADAELEAVGQAIEAYVAENPNALLNQISLFESFLKTGDPSTVDETVTRLIEGIPYPAHQAYYRFLHGHFRNDATTADQALQELVASPELSSQQLDHLIKICRDTEQLDAAATFYQKLAGGGYSTNAKWGALKSLTELRLKQGQTQAAVHSVAALYPEWRLKIGESALYALHQGVTAETLPELRAGIEELLKADPSHERGSHLVAFYQEVCERLEITDAPADFSLSPTQQADLTRFQDLIETWEVAGPYDGPQQSQIATDDLAYAPESRPDEVNWTAVGPKDGFGYVVFDRALSLPSRDTNQKVAYARTQLVSPDDRTVTLSLGSDDWVKVFLNGKEIHRYVQGRPAFPDQDRIQLPLKAGSNQLLVKVGNLTDGWRFCARLAENHEGVEIQLP